MSDMLDWNVSTSENVLVSTRVRMCEADRKAFSEREYTEWVIYVYNNYGEYYELAALPVTLDNKSEYEVPYMVIEYGSHRTLQSVLVDYNEWVSKAVVGELNNTMYL